MKKLVFISIILLCGVTKTNAQSKVTAPEPTFINSFCILTSDSTFEVLPKESGVIGKHKNKISKITGVLGSVANVATLGGLLGVASSSSISGVMAGAKVVHTAQTVGSAADATNALSGYVGMDIIFKGGHSSYVAPAGQDVRLLIRSSDNQQDPLEIYRIVRFNASKKERRFQWKEMQSGLLGSKEAEKSGYMQFVGEQYGEQSYLLTIPASTLEKGEYGVLLLTIASATVVPIGTFSIQ